MSQKQMVWEYHVTIKFHGSIAAHVVLLYQIDKILTYRLR